MQDNIFGALPAQAAAHWPDSSAVHFKGLDYSFAELSETVDRAARGLMALGVERGDKVALLITNRPEFIVAVYAVFKIGAVAVPLNTRYREKDLAYVVGFSECKLLITVDRSGPVDYLGVIANILPEVAAGRQISEIDRLPHLENVVVIGNEQLAAGVSWQRLIANGADVPPGADRPLGSATRRLRTQLSADVSYVWTERTRHRIDDCGHSPSRYWKPSIRTRRWT